LQKALSFTLVAVVQTQQPCEEEEEAAAVQHHPKAFSDPAGLSPPHPPTSYNTDFLSERFASKKKKLTHNLVAVSMAR
jgi:hypothetical protein